MTKKEKEDFLIIADKKYPPGTKYLHVSDERALMESPAEGDGRSLEWHTDHSISVGRGKGYVYSHGIWAKIIEEAEPEFLITI